MHLALLRMLAVGVAWQTVLLWHTTSNSNKTPQRPPRPITLLLLIMLWLLLLALCACRYIAEAIAHEIGHNVGLSHDGTTVGDAYYGGQGDW